MPEVNVTTASPAEIPAVPPEIPTKPAEEFLSDAKRELDLRLKLRQEYEQTFEIWKSTTFLEYEKKQEETIAKGLQEYIKKVEEERKPPEPGDIQKLLDQDYETFSIPIHCYDDETGESKQVTFTVRELPQSVEKRFYRQFKGKIIDKLQMLEAFTQAGIDKPFEDKAKSFLELFDESFDMLAEAVVLVLNPFGKVQRDGVLITKEWVQNNISSDRQWRIVEAQLKVNRLRDFFSKVSTSGREMMTMRRPNFQALQELAA